MGYSWRVVDISHGYPRQEVTLALYSAPSYRPYLSSIAYSRSQKSLIDLKIIQLLFKSPLFSLQEQQHCIGLIFTEHPPRSLQLYRQLSSVLEAGIRSKTSKNWWTPIILSLLQSICVPPYCTSGEADCLQTTEEHHPGSGAQRADNTRCGAVTS